MNGGSLDHEVVEGVDLTFRSKMLRHAQAVGIYRPEWCQGHIHVLPRCVELLLHVVHSHEAVLIESRTWHGHVEILLGVHVTEHKLFFRKAVGFALMVEEIRRSTSVHSTKRR